MLYFPSTAGRLLVRSVCLIASVTCLLSTANRAVAADRPNVLIILADDLGYSDIGCYGSEIETPNLDGLAAGGLRFTQFYNTARCWPTRAALMTGYYPQQTGMDPPRGRLPVWAHLLPDYLKPQGYHSYHSGKWHINGAPLALTDGGFEKSYILEDHDRNFYPKRHKLDDKVLPPVEPGTNYYTTTNVADHAIECLKEHANSHTDEPFLSYVAFTVPHFPLHAPEKDVAKYMGKYSAGWNEIRNARYERQRKMGLVNCPLSDAEPQILAPSIQPGTREQLEPNEIYHAVDWESLSSAQKEFQATKFALHAAMIDRMDQEIGRIVQQVKDMNALDNTIIFFMSDNGTSAEILVRGDGHNPEASPGSAESYLCLGPGGATVGNTPFRRHKIWTHEGGISTPMIVHWPQGITARGELRHDIGHVIDLVPTIIDLADADASQVSNRAEAPPLPGESLVPAFSKDNSVQRDYLYFHHQGNRGLRMGDWKLVSSKDDDNQWELYDLSTDRCEMHDLSKELPDREAAMRKKWLEIDAEFAEEAKDVRPGNGRKPAKQKANVGT